MRIAYLCADRGIPIRGTKGGAAHVRGVVKAFLRAGHRVRVMTTCPDGDANVGTTVVPIAAPAVLPAATACHNARVGRALAHVLSNAAVYERVTAQLESWHADVLYERYSPFGLAGGAAARDHGIPHVLEVNASLATEGARFRRQALPDAADGIEQTVLHQASLVVCVSDELARQVVARGVPAERVMVVPNGVDEELFTPDGEVAPVTSRRRICVGFVGSLKAWHGLEHLADAFRALSPPRRWHLLIVGNGPAGDVVASLERQYPRRVTWMRDVPHDGVADYLRAMDITVAPYPALDDFYFSPLKLLEYMATGRPIVASRIGQIPALLQGGEAGLLVPPGDPAALASAIRCLGDDGDRRARLGRRAAAIAHAEHLWRHRTAPLAERMAHLVDVEEETACQRSAIA